MDTLIQQDIKIFIDENKLFAEAAQDFIFRANQAVQQKGYFTVALSGGHTPQKFFMQLFKRQTDIPWSSIDFFLVMNVMFPLIM